MNLSNRQKDILIGIILGDGHLEQNGKNVRLKIDHTEKQKDYLKWKYLEFNNLASSKPRIIERTDKRTKKEYKRWHFSTFSLELFNFYRNKFYKSNRKIIPLDIHKFLKSPLSLAIWFMDDGHKRTDCNAFRISTESFSLKEQKLLQKCLKDNFKIESKLHRKGKFWNIYIPSRESKRFCGIINQYIVPQMRYKISLTP
ncbi:MAG: LAGLIDADG endonuclease [Patescibacteria group bacterium]